MKIEKYEFSSKDTNYYECEGCGKSWKKIYLILFTKAEMWLCPECLEKLRRKLGL